jgi:hypothetical protein
VSRPASVGFERQHRWTRKPRAQRHMRPGVLVMV